MRRDDEELFREPGVTGLEAVTVRELTPDDLDDVVRIDRAITGRSRSGSARERQPERRRPSRHVAGGPSRRNAVHETEALRTAAGAIERLTWNATRCMFCVVIKSFRCRKTARLFGDQDVATFRAFERSARRKLLLVHRASTLNDLRALPGNRLEALAGERAGQHSIRINRQWRICFVWNEGDAWEVEIVDYH